jgi:hypothetical protein
MDIALTHEEYPYSGGQKEVSVKIIANCILQTIFRANQSIIKIC